MVQILRIIKRQFIILSAIIMIAFLPSQINAQISQGGTPKSFLNSKGAEGAFSVNFDEIILRAPNVEQLRGEDVQSENNGTPPRVGVSLPLSVDKASSGEWTDLPDGGRLWTLKISSPGATAMSVFFDSWYMAPGSSMFFYNENRKHVIGSFNYKNNLDNGTFATEMIQGESIYIEYYEPKLKRGESYFHIASVGYFYKELAGITKYNDNAPKNVGASDACHVNVNCSPVGDDWQDEKRGVAQITFLAGGDWYLCSGTLVNNTSYDKTPYFLTAFHCGAADATTSELNQWVFKFRYEAIGCTNPGSEPSTNSITGCSKKAVGNISGGSDFFLVQLNTTPTVAFKPYYNGWDRTDVPTSTGVGIHHPAGDIKKISTCSPIGKSGSNNISGSIMAANSTYSVKWVANSNGHGVTAGGSSGSPLFNSNGLQIGTLTGGSSSCTNQSSNDIYGRFSYHWISNGGTSANQLKPWLDPTNSGTTTLPGYDPFATAPPVVDFEASATTVIQGTAIDFYNYTENSPTSHLWTFENGTPATSTDINPTGVVYNVIGTHDVTLKSSNANGPATVVKSNYIEVVDPSGTFCDTISQFCCTPTIYSTTAGYVCGTNEYDMTEFAEKYTNYNPYNQITGARFYLAAAKNATGSNVTFNMYGVDGDNPGTVLSSATVSMASVVTANTSNGFIDITFPSPVNIPPGGFFLGFVRPGTPASGDTLALVSNGEDGYISTAYTKYDGSWVQSSSLWTDMENFQHLILPIACYVGTMPPVADFTAVPTSVAVGSTVQFTNISAGTPATSWSWTFSNGVPSTSTLENPIVTYNTAGIFDVSLTVTNANGTDTKTKTAYIEAYELSFTTAFSLDFEACTDFQVDNFAPWTTTDVDLKPTYGITGVTFPNSGYTGSFIALNYLNTTPALDAGWGPHGGRLCGACIAATGGVANNDWLMSTQVTLGTNSSFSFWAKSASATYPTERFNVKLSTTNNAVASFTVNITPSTVTTTTTWTKYTYSLNTYNNQAIYVAIQCVSNDQFALLLDDIEIISTYPPPVADFTVDQTSVPLGGTVNFTDLSTAMPTSWNWTFTGGVPATSTAQNPSIVYNTLGTYPVSLTVTNAQGTDTETKTGYITVTPAPDVIVEWNFPNATDDNIADAGIAVNLNKTILPFGGVNDIQYNTAGVTTRSIGGETWRTGANTKGWQIILNTTGYGDLKLSYAQMSDNATSPRDFKIQYSTNGTAWTDLGHSITLVEDVWKTGTNLVLPAALENQANVYLRWIMTSNTGCGGGAVSSTSTTRRNYMDDIKITGLPLSTPPVANFSASSTSACAGQAITFTDLSTNTPTSWAWTFTGGTPATSTSQNPVITYSTPGTYAVSLTATNPNGSDVETKAAYIIVSANPTISASNTGHYCAGQTIALNATGSGGTSYSWTGPASFTSLVEDPTRASALTTHTGTYTVTLTNTTSGCTASATTNVTVNAAPTISATNTGPYCAGSTITLNATGTGGNTFAWTGPNAFSTSTEDPTIANGQAANAGTYTVVYTNTTTGCTASANTVVAVNAIPTIAPANTGPYCSGQTITLNANGAGGTSFNWTGPNGFTNTASSPTIANGQAINAGTYNVTITNTTSGCTATGTTTVVVNASPTVSASNTGAYCAGQTIALNATGTGGTSYSWTGPASFTSTNEDPTRINALTTHTGTYTVVLTNTTSGCTASTTTNVTVNANPTLSAANTGHYCAGQTITLNATGAGGTSYAWTGPASFTSTNEDPTRVNALTTHTGTYTVVLTNTTSGCTASATTNVTVNANPTISAGNGGPYCAGSTISLTANGTGGSTFAWTGPNAFSTSTEDPNIANGQAANAGTYTVVYTNTTSGCTASATTAVTINASPTLAPTNGGPYCSGQTISLTANGSGGTSYAWTGPSGFTSTNANPTRVNAQTTHTGNYTVVLTNTTSGCTTSATTNVTVNANPTLSAANTGPYCAGQTIMLNATGAGGTSYAWTGPASFTSTNEDPIRVNALTTHTGTYTVILTNTTSGCTASATTNVIVNSLPTVSATNTGHYCAGQTITFNATGNGGTSYSWTGPLGFTSAIEDPTRPASLATHTGTYTVVLTNTTSGCTASATTNVTVNANPTLNATNSGPNCAGGTLTLNATGSGGTQYAWTGPNGFTSSNEDPTIANAQIINSGTYTVVLTNTISSCNTSASTIAVINANPTLSASNSGPHCAGATLTLNANGAGGTQYAWTGPNAFSSALEDPTIANAQPVNSGTYTVVLTNTTTGCTVSATTAATINILPTVYIGAGSTECPGTTITLDAGAGYTYQWSNLETSQTISVNTAGTYSVTVTNGNSCTASASYNLGYFPGLTLAMSSTPESATSANNGTATVTPTGTSPFIIIWSGGQSTNTITGLTGGNYTVTVIDGNGCTASNLVNVTTNNTPPVANFSADITTICAGQTVNFTDLSTNSPTTWSWSFVGASPATSNIPNPIVTFNTPGLYQIILTVTNVDGSDTETKTNYITVNANPTVSATNTGAYCVGSTISFNATGTGGTQYAWSGPAGFNSLLEDATRADAQLTHAGTYNVVITNTTSGCTATASTVVAVNANPTLSAANTGHYCAGQSILLNATGAGGTQYAWTGPAGFTSTIEDPTRTNSLTTHTGAYTVVLTNTTTGCTTSATTNVTINANPTLSASNTGPYCAGQTIALDATGIGGTQYSWTGPAGFNAAIEDPTRINSLTTHTGTYTVVLSNPTTGCTATATTNVTVNANPTLNASNTGPYCAGSAISLNATGTGGTQYAWTGPNAFGSTTEDPTIANAQLVNAGTYTVVLSNTTSGCTTSAATTVVINANPTLSASNTGPYCSGSAITLNAIGSGGTNYAWSGPNGFVSTDEDPTIANAQTMNAGTYSVVLTNTVSGCTSTASTNVIVNETPSISASNSGPYCAGETLTLNANGTVGTDYSWSGPNGFVSTDEDPTIANVQLANDGTYTVVLTNTITGCNNSASTAVLVNPNPTVSASNAGPYCEENTAILNANGAGGANFSWTGPASYTSTDEDPTIANITSANAGTYTVVLTNTLTNCFATATTDLVVNPNPTLSVSNNGPVCENTTVTLNANAVGGNNFAWSGPAGFTSTDEDPIITNATTANEGTYTLVYTNTATGCFETASTVVDVNVNPSVSLGLDINVCAYTPAVLNAGSGFTSYTWNGTIGSETFTALSSGTYTVVVEDNNGCTATDEIEVTINPVHIVTVTTTPESGTGLNDGTASFTVTGGTFPITWTWSIAQTGSTITDLSGGIYCVTVEDTNLCTATACGTVNTDNAPPIALFSTDITEGCVPLTVNFTDESTNNPLTWLYDFDGTHTANSANTSFTFNTPGTYNVILTVENLDGSDTFEKEITVYANPVVDLGENITECDGNTVVLNATDLFVDYLWTGGIDTQTLDVTIGGDYDLVVTDANGCTATDMLTVTFNPSPVIDLGADIVICDNVTHILDAGEGFASYLWNGSIVGQVLIIDAAGTYTVEVTNDYYCTATDEIVVTEIASPIVDLPETLTGCVNELFSYELVGSYNFIEWSNASHESTYEMTYIFTGDYLVWVTVGNESCEAIDTMTVTIDICENVNINNDDLFIGLYPNPTNSISNLVIKGYSGEVNYALLDAQGKEILVKTIEVHSDFSEELDIESIVPGMYFIRVTTNTEVNNLKLIKK